MLSLTVEFWFEVISSSILTLLVVLVMGGSVFGNNSSILTLLEVIVMGGSGNQD